MSVLPPKLYFRIGEVAGLVGVEPHVLRYWEREFRSIRPTKSAKGQRVYSRRDVENLMRVRELLYAEGFTIAGAKKKLQRNGVEPESATHQESSFSEMRSERQHEPHASPAVLLAPEVTPEILHAPRGEATPAPAPRAMHGANQAAPSHVRERLIELKGELEAFLAELGG